MKKILLTIAYDGTNYSGWQKQKDTGIKTVQGALEDGLSRLFKRPVECQGASRTDSGVNALGQRATIELDTTIPAEKMPLAAKSFLPDDIVIVKGQEVPVDFNVRYDVTDKTYEYKILNAKAKNPILRNSALFVYQTLDVEKMNEAAKYFIGEQDFKGFCSAQTETSTTVRTIYSINVDKTGHIITISVNGSGFLYNMVRIIAGTLIEVGKGSINPNHMPDIIASRDRTRAGATVGPEGLCLMQIHYKDCE